jgi:hypothetical protein
MKVEGIVSCFETEEKENESVYVCEVGTILLYVMLSMLFAESMLLITAGDPLSVGIP